MNRGTDAWRFNLRTGSFMDEEPDPSDVPDGVVDFIEEEETWQQLRDEWDAMYPTNPVSSDDGDEE